MQVEETYDDWLRRVRAEGRTEGRTEGETRHAIATVLKVLERRFGALAPEVVERVRAAELTELDRWTDRALDAATLDDVWADAQR